MKLYISRWLYRLYYRHVVFRLLSTSACVCLLVYLVIRVKHADLPKNSGKVHVARNLPNQRPSLGLPTDIKLDLSSRRIHNGPKRIVSDDHFSSPFVVTDTDQKFVSIEDYNEPVTGVPEIARNKTWAIIWPCKGNKTGCFQKPSLPTNSCRFQCQQTWVYEEADVVVFNVFRFQYNDAVPKFHRPRRQRWVMMTREAPVRWSGMAMLDFPAFKGQFNWTMTYRPDSDIPNPYGRLQQQAGQAKDYDRIYREKTATAAWFVSHCPTQSKRDIYVRRMQQVIDIHVYGSCGNYTCGAIYGSRKNQDKSKCLPLLSKTYFFYLAFENSICKDYVTEKFFKLFDDVDVIPVVRGGADYKNNFPQNTFIDASDFRSPEKLAAFLLDVAKDKKRYTSLLKNKNRYGLLPEEGWFCKLCEKMHKDKQEKYFPDLRQWSLLDQCHEPNDM